MAAKRVNKIFFILSFYYAYGVIITQSASEKRLLFGAGIGIKAKHAQVVELSKFRKM